MKEHFNPDQMYVGRDIHVALTEFEAQIRDQTSVIMEQRATLRALSSPRKSLVLI